MFIGFLINLILEGHLEEKIRFSSHREKYNNNSRDEADEELEGEPGHVDGLRQHEQGELLALLALLVPGLDMGMKSSNLNI